MIAERVHSVNQSFALSAGLAKMKYSMPNAEKLLKGQYIMH
jgi:hypothetical protein